MKCPVHMLPMVGGRCTMCGMTEEQAQARIAGSSAAPKTSAALVQNETAPKVETPKVEAPKVEAPKVEAPKVEPTHYELIEARFQALENRATQTDQHVVTLENTVFTLTRTMDRIVTHVDGLVRAVDSLQSLALVHSAEFAAVERLLGYMNAEREYVARQLGIKSLHDITEAVEMFHRQKESKAVPSPDGPIAPEEQPTKQEHDDIAPNAA